LTGEQRWSARGFPNANFIQADGKLIIFDEDGWLVLARPKPEGSLEILAKAHVLRHNAWTLPTCLLTKTRLRIRMYTRLVCRYTCARQQPGEHECPTRDKR
jgi:hypothetical protein